MSGLSDGSLVGGLGTCLVDEGEEDALAPGGAEVPLCRRADSRVCVRLRYEVVYSSIHTCISDLPSSTVNGAQERRANREFLSSAHLPSIGKGRNPSMRYGSSLFSSPQGLEVD